MKFFSRMIGAFEGVMLAVTTVVMIAPFVFAAMGPAANAVH